MSPMLAHALGLHAQQGSGRAGTVAWAPVSIMKRTNSACAFCAACISALSRDRPTSRPRNAPISVPDEIVDNSPVESAADLREVRQKLAAWQRDWETAYRSGQSDDPILRVTAYVFHRYQIPFEYSQHFLAAMTTDPLRSLNEAPSDSTRVDL